MNKQLSPFLQRYFQIITELICNQIRKYRDIFKRLEKRGLDISRLNIHTKIAVYIILLQTPLICLLFARSFEPWVKFQMFYLMAALVTTVLIAPRISSISILRKYLCWADPLNQRQQKALYKFDLVELYKVSQYRDNATNFRPYLERLVILGLTINGFGFLIPEKSPIGAIPLAISTYLCFQVFLISLATNHTKANWRKN